MAALDIRKPDTFSVIHQILVFALERVDKKNVYEFGEKLGLTPKQLDLYLDLISNLYLAHVTPDYYETTNKGAGYIKDYPKLLTGLKS